MEIEHIVSDDDYKKLSNYGYEGDKSNIVWYKFFSFLYYKNNYIVITDDGLVKLLFDWPNQKKIFEFDYNYIPNQSCINYLDSVLTNQMYISKYKHDDEVQDENIYKNWFINNIEPIFELYKQVDITETNIDHLIFGKTILNMQIKQLNKTIYYDRLYFIWCSVLVGIFVMHII